MKSSQKRGEEVEAMELAEAREEYNKALLKIKEAMEKYIEALMRYVEATVKFDEALNERTIAEAPPMLHT